MVPIHDTDIAEERWTRAEWEHYELWEKVEQRVFQKRRLWILATILVFLIISAVPIVKDRWPKWAALKATRELAQEINQIKKEANIKRAVYRLRFDGSGSLAFTVEKVNHCADATGAVIRRGTLSGMRHASLALLDEKRGDQVGVPGLSMHFCYDFLDGSDLNARPGGMAGFGIIPAKDLTENRLDRLSVLLVSGPLGEISFD